jgi:hypothetical protein
MKGTLSVIGLLIVVCVVASICSGCAEQEEGRTRLTLKDYPELFAEETIIIVGQWSTQGELESAAAISENMEELTGTKPIVRNDAEVPQQERVGYNLIAIGLPGTNQVLSEVYEAGSATKVTEVYPGANKGILQIMANPWDLSQALLIVAGSNEEGVIASSETLMGDEQVEGLDNAMMITEYTKGQQTNGGVDNATVDSLLGKYETGDRVFKRYEIGSKIVYFHQRMIGHAIVEGDFIRYQFDRDTEELLDKEVHWRDDLPEDLPAVISKEEAEAMVSGDIQSSRLYFISPESAIYPIEPTPENPCWVIRIVADGNITVKIFDAVTGDLLGHGVPPPRAD